MTNNNQLWQRLVSGEKKALEELYLGHITDLINYGKRYTSDAELVEDCIHDLFVYIWNRRQHLSTPKNLRSYLIVSLRRSIYKSLQSKSKNISDERTEDKFIDFQFSAEDLLVQKELHGEKKKLLKQAIDQLSPRQKEVLYLKYYSNLDYDEICESLGINYQSVRNVLSAAIKALRKALMIFICFILFIIQ